MAETLQTYSDQTWEKDVLGSQQPVLVDFWAEWCVPCKTLVPIIEAVAAQFNGKSAWASSTSRERPGPLQVRHQTCPLMLSRTGRLEQRNGLIKKRTWPSSSSPNVR
jgi:thioredoxin 1